MKKIISLAICAIAAFSATATTYYVDKENGSDDNDGKASDRAFATAEKGFKAVHNKDTANLELVIASGVYDLSAACACAGGPTEAKRVIVRSETGNPNDVVLNAGGKFECLRISQHVTVSGITVSNGINRVDCVAGGIRFAGSAASGAEFASIVSNCVVTCCTNVLGDTTTGFNGAAGVALFNNDLLVNSVVRNNFAQWRGAGVIMINNETKSLEIRGPKMKGCRIEDNESNDAGAGVYVASYQGSSSKLGGLRVVEIEDSDIVRNTSKVGGVGVFCTDNLDLRVSGCNISSNDASTGSWGGGGLRFQKGLLTVTDCTIEGNAANSGGGLDIVGSAATTLYCTNTVIRNNTANAGGGGCRVYEIPRVFFDGCRFEGNFAKSQSGEGSGGGLILANQQPGKYGYCSVSNCVFASNKTNQRGGGLSGTWGGWFHGAIVNCVFTNNTSTYQGGGLSIREENGTNPDPAIIRNCLFAFNETTYEGASNNSTDSNGGGVVLVTYADVAVENCTIVSNNINNANSSKYISGGIHHRWGGTLKNCIVAFNTVRGQPEPTSGNASCTAGDNLYINCCGYPAVPRFTAENGCIAADPKFVDLAHGDFRLAEGSPCINKGLDADWMTATVIDPVTGKRVKVLDLAGSPRLSGTHVDIGCYELYFPKGSALLIR